MVRPPMRQYVSRFGSAPNSGLAIGSFRRHPASYMVRWFALRRLLSCFAFLFLAGCAHRAPGGERLFVSDDAGGAVVGVDMPTVGLADRIAVGGRPRGMVLSPDRATLYVAVSTTAEAEEEADTDAAGVGAEGIAVIDVATARVLRLLPAGKDPVRIAISRDGHTLFVANQADGAITATAADGSGKPRTAAICETPEGIAPRQDGRALFVACVDSNRVAMIDPQTMHILRRIRVRGGPRVALAARDGRHIYIATDNGRLAILNADGTVARTLDLARDTHDVRAAGMVEAPDSHLFVTTGRYGAIVEVDPKAGTIARTIAHVGTEPMGIGISADGATLVTANGASGDVSVINRVSGKIVRKLNVGKRPWGVAAGG